MPRPVEISDLIVSFDPVTLESQPVLKRDVVSQLLSAGDRRAVHIVERMPERDGHLDRDFIKHLLVVVHCEIQRLAEEFQHGHRMRAILAPILASLPDSVVRPRRVVDIGCGTGYMLRWLARFGSLGPDVELVGVDLNRDLIDEASHLASQESLRVRFEHGDAFKLKGGAAVYVSTGVLHHFEAERLARFFSQQCGAEAVIHFDFRPSRLAWLGSWFFHELRMRQPLSRHDGVVSARRAHTAEVLTNAAIEGMPGFNISIHEDRAMAAFQILVARRREAR